MNRYAGLFAILLFSAAMTAQTTPSEAPPRDAHTTLRDVHSYAQPHLVRVKHLNLDLTVDFPTKTMTGTAELQLEKSPGAANAPLMLDTRELEIKQAFARVGDQWRETNFELGQPNPILGRSLKIELPERANAVRIQYVTSPKATAVQWLEPAQTAGKKLPFVFTQGQAIHTRSWIPLQDSPGIRITYSAQVRVPKPLIAVMSAEGNPQEKEITAAKSGATQGVAKDAATNVFKFSMSKPIPPYLIALAVGDISYRSLGQRTGVYTEPAMLDRSAKEFEDTEKMVAATEKLYGPYRWTRYDLLVLPPAFPYGGMENPMLTFATPTILAGDKSLVALVAHELAHSWSGNLVTNATWRDFWLNEGFTVYVERRVIEALYGPRRENMEASLGKGDLLREFEGLKPEDQVLHINLTGRDPDDGSNEVPYEKGALFLRQLEQTFGRARFDRFLRGYFDHFAFQSITTEQFVAYLKKNLFEQDQQLAARIPLDEWLTRPGLPDSAPDPKSDAFTRVEQQAAQFASGKARANRLQTKGWTTHEWLHFLRSLPKKMTPQQMAELDRAFKFTSAGNSEITAEWLAAVIRSNYTAGYARLEDFLMNVGRRKFLKPLYEELAKTPDGKQRALAIYQKARDGYHPISYTTVDQILGWGDQPPAGEKK